MMKSNKKVSDTQMQKGINQWCFPQGTSLEELFTYSHQAGFTAVELNLNQPGDIGFTMETTTEEMKDIAQLAEEKELELKSLSTALLWEYSLSSPDVNVRKKGKEVVQKMLEIAHTIGMDTILIVPGEVTAEVSYEECYERSQKSLQSLLPLAKKLDVKMGIENVWNKFLLSPLEMAKYIDELDSNHLGVYFDVGNILQYGFPEQWIRILGKRIFKIHVKDFHQGIGNAQGFTNLLSGHVDWKAVMEALRSIGYEDTLVTELSPYSLSDVGLAQDASRHLDIILHL